jgi:dihydroxy-acid dehydratase
VDVARGIREAGGTPMEFNTIAISDGITMGTEGMKTSLISREAVADTIELVARGHYFDGLVCLVACDKTIPGAAMALLRLNIPGIILYGGSILPGRLQREGRHHPGRLRGRRRLFRRQDHRSGTH